MSRHYGLMEKGSTHLFGFCMFHMDRWRFFLFHRHFNFDKEQFTWVY